MVETKENKPKSEIQSCGEAVITYKIPDSLGIAPYGTTEKKNYIDKIEEIALARPDWSENRKQDFIQSIKLATAKQIRKLSRYQPHYRKEEIMAFLDLTSSQYDELVNLRK